MFLTIENIFVHNINVTLYKGRVYEIKSELTTDEQVETAISSNSQTQKK